MMTHAFSIIISIIIIIIIISIIITQLLQMLSEHNKLLMRLSPRETIAS